MDVASLQSEMRSHARLSRGPEAECRLEASTESDEEAEGGAALLGQADGGKTSGCRRFAPPLV